ncbi:MULTISPECIES: hypothetical protein [Bacillales]|uniref:hypothetical protein n=1 Tax=Bacillales TaxID=1385 RepID=UPI0012928D57|nr:MULTISPECIES: hypothetical protein [Bacillaceae]
MKFGKKRIYNDEFEGRNNVVMWDVLKIDNEQTIKLTFISKNSKNRQGVRLGIDVGEGYIEVNGLKSKSIELWEDTAPKEVLCKCVSSEGLLSVYNIWDKGKGRQSQLLTSGMILEEKDNKIIYYCNDYGFETDFDKLVFSIEKL